MYKFSIDKFKGLDPEKLAQYFDAVISEYGELSPEVIVENAKKKDNILHNFFEWNNNVAAKCYRIEQAKDIIRSVMIVKSDEIVTRAFVSVKVSEKSNRTYQSIDVCKNNTFAQQIMLSDAKRDMRIFISKYNNLVELTDIINKMKEVVK